MKKTKLFPVLLLAFGLVLTGCETGGNNEPVNPPVYHEGNDGTLEHPYTSAEAVIKCDEAGTNKFVDNKPVYVVGTFDANTTVVAATNTWSGSLDGVGFSIDGAKLASTMNVAAIDGKLNGKKVVACGYVSLANGKYSMKAANDTDPTIITIDGNANYVDTEGEHKHGDKGTLENPFTVDEAVALMDEAGAGVVVDRTEYYVKGVMSETTINLTYHQWYGTLGGKIDVGAYMADGINVSEVDGALDGEEVVIKGFLELYEGKYKMNYLPASVSPTGEKYTPTIVAVPNYVDGLTKMTRKVFGSRANNFPQVEGAAWEMYGIEKTTEYQLFPYLPAAWGCSIDNGDVSLEDKYFDAFEALGWYCYNDDEGVIYEDFGYIFGDDEDLTKATIVVNFYSYSVEDEEDDWDWDFVAPANEEPAGDWYFDIEYYDMLDKYSGHFTDYYGNELPFFWEHYQELGYTVGGFPGKQICSFFGIAQEDMVDLSYFGDCCYTIYGGYYGEDGYTPLTVECAFDMSYENSIIDYLDSLGFEIIYGGYFGEEIYAVDPDHSYVIHIYEDYDVIFYEDDTYDFADYGIICAFIPMDELLDSELSSATDWSSEEKATIASILGDIELPFMQFGAYGSFFAYEEDNELIFADYYYLDLTADYGEVLIANGYEYVPFDEELYEGDYYIKEIDGALVTISMMWDIEYAIGNYIDIVITPAPIPATELILDKTTAEIVQGSSLQLNATFGPEGCVTEGLVVTWSSSNEKVTVANGLVRVASDAAVGSTATITATCGAMTASCVVTVLEKQVSGDTVTDTFTAASFAATGTSYTENNGVKDASSAEYYAYAAKSNAGAIQINSKNGYGIVSTKSGGTIKSVSITFNSSNSNSVKVYASNEPFTTADMLSGTKTGMTCVATLDKTTSSYEFTADYAYVGIVSAKGAVYMDSISFSWNA